MSHALLLTVDSDYEQLNRWSNDENEIDGKWDWCGIGGRWDGELILKDGSKVNEATAGLVDWAAMDDREVVRMENGRRKAEESEAKYGKPDLFFVDHEPRRWMPFAVLIGGDWREQGRLCWFGQVDDENVADFYEGFQEYRDALGPNRKLTIVDYHQ